ncbi:MAG: SWIM zinc finger family protein [bacterium]
MNSSPEDKAQGTPASEEASGYHRALPLTSQQLEQMCSPRVYRLAWRYAKSAHVSDKMRAGACLTARFHGTRGIYDTRLDLTDRQFHFSCTCPLGGSREPCKHVIALGVTWIHEPESFHDLELTLARLSNLRKPELITLIREIASRMPEVIPLLDRRKPS